MRVRLLSVLVVALMVIFTGSAYAVTTVSGTITLPAEVAVYDVDKSFSVTLAYDWNNGWPRHYRWCGQFPLIAQQTSAQFSCEIEDEVGAVAVYAYPHDMDGVYRGPNYYNSTGTGITADSAEHLSAGAVHDIVLPLLRGITVSGELRLPPGSGVFDEVKTLVISFYHQRTSQYGHTIWHSSGYSQDLPAGADHLDYSLHVPGMPNPVKIGYSWPYPYDDVPDGYVSHGYYHPEGTVYGRDHAAEVSTTTSLSDRHMTILQGIPLHGTLHLPNGILNSQEMTVDIRLVNTDWSINQTRSVTIPADTPSVPFSFYLPPGQQVRLEYTSVTGADRHYITPGYYRPGGTSADYWPLSWVSTDAPTPHIDISLLPGVEFSGKIFLPDGITHPETIFGHIWVDRENNFYGYTPFSIAAGEIETDWSLVFPPTAQNVTVQTYLYTDQYDPGPEFLELSYFNSGGTAGIRENAEPVNGSTDKTDIDIALLKGNLIEGTIGLASPDLFVNGGHISLQASWGSSNVWQELPVAADQAGVGFTLAIPHDAPDYIVFYYQWGAPARYLQRGYYNAGQTGYCESDADSFTSGNNYPNTNIQLLQGFAVDGSVSLANNATSPEEIPIALGALYRPSDGQQATTLVGSYQTSVTLPANSNTVGYELSLPPDCSNTPGGYLVGYRHTNPDYVRYGYYHPTGTAGLPSNSLPLDPGMDHPGIDLQLIEGNEITGTITLPSGTTVPPEGIAVTLGTLQEPNGLFHTTVTITEPERSTGYTVRVAPDVGDVALAYWLPEDLPLATRGYYSSGSTLASRVTGRYDYANQFAATANHPGNDFVLDPGNMVSGTIYTPNAISRSLPIEVTLAADPTDPDTVYWHGSVMLPAGSTEVPYARQLVLDSAIKAKYTNRTNPQWAPAGFYYDETTSVSTWAASPWLARVTDHLFIDLLLTDALAGDINADGVVDLADAILGLQIISGVTISGEIFAAGDVDGDGTLGMAEVLYILRNQ